MLKRGNVPLMLAALVVLALLAVTNLPYGNFSWRAVAQYDSLPPNVAARYNVNGGFQVFLSNDGRRVEVYAACVGTNCREIAQFGVSSLSVPRPSRSADGETRPVYTSRTVEGWSVRVFYLGQNRDNLPVFQVNVFGPNGLVDDRLELVVRNNQIVFQPR